MTTVAAGLRILRAALKREEKPKAKRKPVRKTAAKKPARRAVKAAPKRRANPAPRKHHKFHIALIPAFDSLASAEAYAKKFAKHHNVALQVIKG